MFEFLWRRASKPGACSQGSSSSSNNGPAAPASAALAPNAPECVKQRDEHPDMECDNNVTDQEVVTDSIDRTQDLTAGMLKDSATQTGLVRTSTTRSADPLCHKQSRAESEENCTQGLHPRPAESLPLSDAPSLPVESRADWPTVPPDRLSAWVTFTDQHDQLLGRRIRGDEARRVVRQKRQTFQAQAKEFMAAVNTLVCHDLYRQSELLDQASRELEEEEKKVEEMEDELVQAESYIAKMLPAVLGSDRDQTLELLNRHELYLRPVSSSDATSQPDAPLGDHEVSLEHSQFLSELDKVDLIEDQLLVLRKEKKLLRNVDEAELDTISLAFLRNFESEDERLSSALKDARFRLELVRDELQPPLPVSDDEGGYSE